MTKHFPSPSSVVKVGRVRGFVIEYRISVNIPHLRTLAMKRLMKRFRNRRSFFVQRRLVITAAHCLPKLPPPHSAAFFSERPYAKLLGSLGSKKNEVWAECLFADPVADIAVLGCPDEQELAEQADAYRALSDDAATLRIYSLAGTALRCRLVRQSRECPAHRS